MKKMLIAMTCFNCACAWGACTKASDPGRKGQAAADSKKSAVIDPALTPPARRSPPRRAAPVAPAAPTAPVSTALTCVEKAALSIKGEHPKAAAFTIRVAKSIRWTEKSQRKGRAVTTYNFALLATFTPKRGRAAVHQSLYVGRCKGGFGRQRVQLRRSPKALRRYLSAHVASPGNRCGRQALTLIKKQYNEGGMHVQRLSGPFVLRPAQTAAVGKQSPETRVVVAVDYAWDAEFNKRKPGRVLYLGRCAKRKLKDTNGDGIVSLNDLKRG